MYRPLPPEVTIKKSFIDGLGLFATCDIEAGHNLGITHVANDNFENQYIRTPLGGFINHSNTPNCTLIKTYPNMDRVHGLDLSDNGGDIALVLVTKQ